VEETVEIFERTRENGLVVSKSGANRNILRMVPPMCLEMSDVAQIAEAMDESLRGF